MGNCTLYTRSSDFVTILLCNQSSAILFGRSNQCAPYCFPQYYIAVRWYVNLCMWGVEWGSFKQPQMNPFWEAAECRLGRDWTFSCGLDEQLWIYLRMNLSFLDKSRLCPLHHPLSLSLPVCCLPLSLWYLPSALLHTLPLCGRYGFVTFESDEDAEKVLAKVSGQWPLCFFV